MGLLRILIPAVIRNSKPYYLFKNEIFRVIRKIAPDFRKPVAPVGEGSISPRYCYAVFMRHIVHLFKNGMTVFPNRVAEFGPGNSLGVGLCAMLAGAKEYYALDLVEYADNAHNLEVLESLVKMFRERAAIPDDIEFPEVRPLLDDYSFPSHIFSNDLIEKNLSAERVGLIQNALTGKKSGDIILKYIVPWENYTDAYPKVDLVMSQAVLEHIDNLEHFYMIMNKILMSGGFVSHDIDFRCHGETYEWNGHWAVSDKKWKKIRDGRPFVINREPLSTHLRMLEKNEIRVINKMPCIGSTYGMPSIRRKSVVNKYNDMTDEDFETATCYIVAQKYQGENIGSFHKEAL